MLLNTNIPELTGTDTALCLANLETLWARGERMGETMLAMISELADAILRDANGDPDTVDSILLSLLASDPAMEDDTSSMTVTTPQVTDEAAAVNDRDLHAAIPYTGLSTRLRLYRFLSERAGSSDDQQRGGDSRSADTSPMPTAARGRIAYMAGAFADKAYARFAVAIPRARATVCHSFREACEEVYAGDCEYAILPVMTQQGGRLISFSQLMLHYDLAAVAMTDLENGADEGQSMRFALLQRREVIRPLTLAGETGTHLEVLHAMPAPTFPQLLMAADYCGLTFCSADTLPLLDDEADTPLLTEFMPSTPRLLCVLGTAGADLSTFLRYLRLEAPDDLVIGHYNIV